jgi:tetratricopeptide (TPR) repeat protein
MKKNPITYICLLIMSFNAIAQTDTLSPKETKEFIKKLNFGPENLSSKSHQSACLCIDSIETKGKTKKAINAKIGECIDKEVVSNQLMVKLFASMSGEEKNRTISINTDKKSTEYQKDYFELERWLTDSCASLKHIVRVEDVENKHSFSENKDALEEYSKGIALLSDKKYKEAIPFFEKCVKIDPKFAFAWDNLGACHRRLENFDAAIKAYKKSLSIDPDGTMPLHNLPVAYELKKDYDNAIIHYKNISKVLPDDPETYYGLGRIYTFYKVDLEKGLDYFCQAYNAYIKQNSPYRTDAEKNINYIYAELKKADKLDIFSRVLEKNNITPNKK